MSTQQVSSEQLVAYITHLLEAHNLELHEFEELGEADELVELDPDLQLAYKAIWPVVKEPQTGLL